MNNVSDRCQGGRRNRGSHSGFAAAPITRHHDAALRTAGEAVPQSTATTALAKAAR
jgi:hypothetical protein